MDSHLDFWTAKALLEWQVELGADEPILDAPVDRYLLTERPTPAKVAGQPPSAPPIPEPVTAAEAQVIAVTDATRAAAGARDLAGLAAAMAAYPHCDLKRGARNLVFADGNPAARVMIVGEAPDRDEDIEGRPFAGKAGQLLNRMLAAIDLGRDHADPAHAVYLVDALPWKTPNRAAEPGEIAMFRPFLERHIALAQPDIVVLMGNTPCLALLGRSGITRLRGQWANVLGRPALPMFHPTDLLRTPTAKREAWADLLAIKARLMGQP